MITQPGDLYKQALSLFLPLGADYLNIDAVFSDETEYYRIPSEPKKYEPIHIKLRVAADNIDHAYIIYDNRELLLKKFKTETSELFDYYETIIPGINKKTTYYFKIIKNSKIYFYNKKGVDVQLDSAYHFTVIPDFNVPNWARGAVIYQIYVDRFYNGDQTNDVVNNEYAYLGKAAKKIEQWDTPVVNDDICNFYGGDLQGVIDKMGYLKELGVDAIYFNPVFVSPSNHKYDTQDYDYIDPHYGVIVNDGGEPLYFEKFNNRYATKYIKRTTDKENLEASNELMIRLIEIAHKNGIKVILDGVFNHCGAFNKWLDRENFYSGQSYPVGAYRTQSSIYNDYFRWYDKNWPNNDCYDSWWGHDNHPKLNFEGSKELYDYILDIGRKWVSPPFNADGWRLDVAADLGCSKEFNHRFWRDFRDAVKKANKDAVILAEHYGDAADWLQGDQWDTLMNYDAFMEPLTWFLTGMEKHSESFNEGLLCNASAFEGAMRYNMAKFTSQSLYTAMNELSNHDHSRFLTRTNKKVGRLHTAGNDSADTGINKGVMREAVMFQMTWPGAPTIYYGDEAGVTGWTDPDNRRTYPWGREDVEMIEYHKILIGIHKKYDAFINGSTRFLTLDYGVVSYGRWDRNEHFVAVLNNNSIKKAIKVPVWNIDIPINAKMESLIFSDEVGFTAMPRSYFVKHGILEIEMPPFSCILLKEKG